MDTALPKRQRIKRQNRQFILDGARRIFAEQGYDAATVRDIIRATPLAAGTFYNYFTSKEEVRRALNQETAMALRPRLTEGRAEATTRRNFFPLFSVRSSRSKPKPARRWGRPICAPGLTICAPTWKAPARGACSSHSMPGRWRRRCWRRREEIAGRLAVEGGDTAKATAAATLLFLRGVQPPL